MRGLFDKTEKDFQEYFSEDQVEIVVIGAGVMGATIAQYLRLKGHQVLILDNEHPESGSKPCGGLIKPSRFTELDNDEFKIVISVLDECFGLYPVKMILRPSGNLVKVATYGLNMDNIFGVDKTWGKVEFINPKGVLYYQDVKKRIHKVKFKKAVISAAYESKELLPELADPLGLIVKRGFSFHFKGKIDQDFVKFWAPYKQVTVHNSHYQGEEIVWAGDGSALTLPSWYEKRIDESYQRVIRELGTGYELIRVVKGLRCFTRSKKYKPCAIVKMDTCYMAVGSGKMGLISAGFSANKIWQDEFNTKKDRHFTRRSMA